MSLARLALPAALLSLSCAPQPACPAPAAPAGQPAGPAASAPAAASAAASSAAPAASGASAPVAVPPVGLLGCSPPEVCQRMVASFQAGELAGEATRRMNKGDGKGCIEHLDQAARIDPAHTQRYGFLRGQCEMLAGRCQEGKKTLEAAYAEMSVTMPPESRRSAIDAMVSLYCRGDDVSPRERLLRASFNLQQGAFITVKDAAFCRENYAIVRKLGPSLKADGDTQVQGAVQSLFVSGPRCLARAGDCPGAWALFRESFPAENLAQLPDQATRDRVLRQSFDSSVETCKGKIL